MLSTLFPERIGENGEGTEAPEEDYWQDAQRLNSKQQDYLERVDDEALMRLAIQHDLRLKVEKRPGEFVSTNTLLALILPTRASPTRSRKHCSDVSVWERIERAIRTRFTRFNN
jgi:uncharacterized membrane protein